MNTSIKNNQKKEEVINNLELVSRAYYDLLRIYNYQNKEKLQIIFKHWLSDLCFAFNKNLSIPPNTLDLFSFICSCDDISFRSQNISLKRASFSKRAKLLIWSILQNIPISVAVFRGGQAKLNSSLLYSLSYYKLYFRNPQTNNEFRELFIEKIKNKLPKDFYLYLVQSIPTEFFLEQINGFNFPKKIVGSPTCFYDHIYFKSLSSNKKIKFIGIQHGANYGEFLVNKQEEFERRVSDTYYLWGLGGQNIVQNRYKINNPKDRQIKNLIMVGSVKTNSFLSSYFKGIDQIYKDTDKYEPYLLKEINNIYPISYLSHPKQLKYNSNYKENRLLKEMNKKELYSTLFLIDRPGHTFLYQAIYQGIPFILYYNRTWLKLFTPSFNHFIENLQKNKLLFFWDQEVDFLKHVSNLLSSQNYNKSYFELSRSFLIN